MRLVTGRVVGAASVLVAVLGAVGRWSPPQTFRASTAFGLVVGALGLFLAFGLWRLAVGGPGGKTLGLSFAFEILTLAGIMGAIGLMWLATILHAGGAVESVARLSVFWLPGVLSITSSGLFAIGLVRSSLVPTWVAWFVAASVALGIVATLVVWPAQIGMVLDSTEAAGMALFASRTRFATLRDVSAVLDLVSLVTMGIALMLRAPAGRPIATRPEQ